MLSPIDIASTVLRLPDPEFFAPPPQALRSMESRLLDIDFEGVAINAPKQIWIGHHETLPLLLAIRCTGDRDWDVPLADNCILAAANLHTGDVLFAPALLTEKEIQSRGGRTPSPRGPKPPGLAIVAVQVTSLDARRPLRLPWNTGFWSFAILHYDWVSNQAPVELIGDAVLQPPPPKTIHPPAQTHPGTRPRQGLFRETQPMLPTYLPTPKTPPPPPVGAEFNLEYGTRDGRATLEVFCSFIVSIRPAHLAPPRPSTPPTDPNTPAAAALVPVTIALLTLGCIRPLQFDCVVPIYGQPLNPGSPARGMFALDLLALKPGMPLPPGPCVAYVLIDGSVSGPRRFRIP